MLDAHQLNVFLTAARTLNFTAAARQLHMTQPSVSQHIQALEQHFDLQLFIRSGRHLRLTDAGEALLPMAQEMVSISQSIDNKMESLKGMFTAVLLWGVALLWVSMCCRFCWRVLCSNIRRWRQAAL